MHTLGYSKRVRVDSEPGNHDVLQRTVLLVHRRLLHRLQGVHSVYHSPDDRVHIVQLGLLVVDDVELAPVRVGLLLRHRDHSPTVELAMRGKTRSNAYAGMELVWNATPGDALASLSSAFSSLTTHTAYPWDLLPG